MAHSTYVHHETFSFMMSLPAMSFGDRFCFRGRWVGAPEGCKQHGRVWARL